MLVSALDVDFFEHRKRHPVGGRAKFSDLFGSSRLLKHELIARKAKNGETALSILFVQFFKRSVLRGEAALRRDVDNHDGIAGECVEASFVAFDGDQRNICEAHSFQITFRAVISLDSRLPVVTTPSSSRVTLTVRLPAAMAKGETMTECIHGLDTERCDACAPRKRLPSDALTGTTKPARARPQRSSRAGGSTKKIAVDPGTRRIFHLTHVKNLEGILKESQIRSDAAGAKPVVDISATDNRELRREASAGPAPVAAYVPFTLVADSAMWEGLRNGEANFRLSEKSGDIPASEFVVLVGSVRGAGADALITDGDAADPATRFSSPAMLGGRMPRREFEEEDSLRYAEFLVLNAFPFSSVTLVGVANDKVRSRVRELMGIHGFTQKVSVYPPWFQRLN